MNTCKTFMAIDFETATAQRASICEAGICLVKEGRVMGTRSWLVHPQGNRYSYWNIKVHGIRPEDTLSSPGFPEVWAYIAAYLEDYPILVAHNAAFDMGCIRSSLELYGLNKPEASFYCSLRVARRLYDFDCHRLDYLCETFDIPFGQHHRAGDDAAMCARLFLREQYDMERLDKDLLSLCGGKL